MVLEYKYGPMEQNMREFGKITKQMEKGGFIISKEMFMMENGLMTK